MADFHLVPQGTVYVIISYQVWLEWESFFLVMTMHEVVFSKWRNLLIF